MKFLGAILALGLVNSQIINTPQFSVNFNGQSGGFKLIDSHDNTFYNMRYGWITEVPQNKKMISFSKFNVGYDGNKTYVNSIYTSGSFNLQIKNEIYNNNHNFTNEKNQTVVVEKDTMKLTILMSGWNFVNYNNNLTLDFTLSNNIGSSITTLDNNTIVMKNFNFEFEPTVIADNIEKPIDFYITGNKYYLTFPSFHNDLYYDPTITYNDNLPTSFAETLKLNMILISLLSVFLYSLRNPLDLYEK